METRSNKEWADLVGKFEIRQVARLLDEGRALDGPTAEIVQELRSHGGYQGSRCPDGVERRTGETVAAGPPDPSNVGRIIDRFPGLGRRPHGRGDDQHRIQAARPYPVTTSSVSAGWAASERRHIGTDRILHTGRAQPDQTLGVQIKLTRKTIKQSGPGLEQAVRRDMNGAIAKAMDRAVFLGAGGSGGPLASSLAGRATASADRHRRRATWAAFRGAVGGF